MTRRAEREQRAAQNWDGFSPAKKLEISAESMGYLNRKTASEIPPTGEELSQMGNIVWSLLNPLLEKVDLAMQAYGVDTSEFHH